MLLKRFVGLVIGIAVVAAPTGLDAAPYASNVEVSGTTVNFILNEPADLLSYSINGGAPIALDGSTKGQKSFALTSPTDTFSIVAETNAAVGYTIPTGEVIPVAVRGWSQPTDEAGFALISDDEDLLTRFPNPRGVGVSTNPNAPNFGTAYIANSTPNVIAERNVGRGLYALRADGSDAFGHGDTAQNPLNVFDGFAAFVESANSPYRLFVADDGHVFVADWTDDNGNVFQIDPMLTEARNLLEGFGGPPPPMDNGTPTSPDGNGLPEGQNHGSIAAVHVTGSLAEANLVLYSMDEDLNSAQFGEAEQNDRNSVWRYEIGGAVPSNVTPTKVASGLIGDFAPGGVTVDMSRGADGKIYMAQFRFDGFQAGILVADESGEIVFDSLQATRDLLDDPTAVDLFYQTRGIAVSPDQQWLAVMIAGSDVGVIPLVDGIPDIANRMMVDTEDMVILGRDIAFDAAGNIHYVSSGQGRYRVLGPGGHTVATTSWDGTEFAFDIERLDVVALPGDFNGDGVVDAADYTVWRDGLGTEFEMEHYDEWRNNFGATTPGAAATVGAVPEPGTLMLALVGVAAAGWYRRRLA